MQCKQCNKEFFSNHWAAQCCSKECNNRYNYLKRKGDGYYGTNEPRRAHKPSENHPWRGNHSEANGKFDLVELMHREPMKRRF